MTLTKVGAFLFVPLLLLLLLQPQRTDAQTGACCALAGSSGAFPDKGALIVDISCAASLEEETCANAGSMTHWEASATCDSSQSWCGCCPDSSRIALNPSGERVCVDPTVFDETFQPSDLASFTTFHVCNSQDQMCQHLQIVEHIELFIVGSSTKDEEAHWRYCSNCNVPFAVPLSPPPAPVPCPNGIDTFCLCAGALPTAAPTPPPCTCPQAEATVVPPHTVNISCSSATIANGAYPLAYSNTQESPEPDCQYSGVSIPTVTRTAGDDAPCAETVEIVWHIPPHQTCSSTQGITIEQIANVADAAAATVLVLPDLVLSCVDTEAEATSFTPTPLPFSNTEAANSPCHISGTIPLVFNSNKVNACGFESELERRWSGVAGPSCDGNLSPPTQLTFTQYIHAMAASVPAFDSLETLPHEPLTCVAAHNITATRLTFSNDVVANGSRCAIRGFADGDVTHTPNMCGGHLTEQWDTVDMCGHTLSTSNVRSVLAAPEATFTDATLPEDTNISCLDFITSYQRPTLAYSNNVSFPSICAIHGQDYGQIAIPSQMTPIPFRIDLCGTTLVESWHTTDRCGRTIEHRRELTIDISAPDTCCLAATEPICIGLGLDGIFFTEHCFFATFATDACNLIGGTHGMTQTECSETELPGEHCHTFVSRETECGWGPCFAHGITQCNQNTGEIIDTCVEGIARANNDTTADNFDDDCNGRIDDGVCWGHGVATRNAAQTDIEDTTHRSKLKVCHVPTENPHMAYTVEIERIALDNYLHYFDTVGDRVGPCPKCICEDGYAHTESCGACYSVESGDLHVDTTAVCRPIPINGAEIKVSDRYELHIVCNTMANKRGRPRNDPPRCSGKVQAGDIIPSFDGNTGLDCACRQVVGACRTDMGRCEQTAEEDCVGVFQGANINCPGCDGSNRGMAVYLSPIHSGDHQSQPSNTHDRTRSGTTATQVAVASVTFIAICIVLAVFAYGLVKFRKHRRANNAERYTAVVDDNVASSDSFEPMSRAAMDIRMLEVHED